VIGKKELERLSANVVGRIFPRIEALAQNPHPLGCRKLRGFKNLWYIRIGDYHVVYQVFDDKMEGLRDA